MTIIKGCRMFKYLKQRVCAHEYEDMDRYIFEDGPEKRCKKCGHYLVQITDDAYYGSWVTPQQYLALELKYIAAMEDPK